MHNLLREICFFFGGRNNRKRVTDCECDWKAYGRENIC